MAEYTLDQIKSYRPPKKLPEIAGLAYDLYDAAGFKVTDEILDKLRAELESKYGDLKALTDDLCGLCAFIVLLMEVRDDAKAAEKIAKLIQDQESQYRELGEWLAMHIQDHSAAAAELLEAFSGMKDESRGRAPVFGEDAPDGALPVASIKPVAEPPLIKTGTMKQTGAPKKKKKK